MNIESDQLVSYYFFVLSRLCSYTSSREFFSLALANTARFSENESKPLKDCLYKIFTGNSLEVNLSKNG